MIDQANTLEVRGAALYYKLRGAGPVLLMIQGGAGDAESSDRLVDGLVDAYTVMTFDRRGLSRSRVTDKANGPNLETHGEDAHHLLRDGDDMCRHVFAAPSRGSSWWFVLSSRSCS